MELQYYPPGTECFAIDSRLNVRRVKITDVNIWLKEDHTTIQHLIKPADGPDDMRVSFHGGNWQSYDRLALTEEDANVVRQKDVEIIRGWVK